MKIVVRRGTYGLQAALRVIARVLGADDRTWVENPDAPAGEARIYALGSAHNWLAVEVRPGVVEIRPNDSRVAGTVSAGVARALCTVIEWQLDARSARDAGAQP